MYTHARLQSTEKGSFFFFFFYLGLNSTSALGVKQYLSPVFKGGKRVIFHFKFKPAWELLSDKILFRGLHLVPQTMQIPGYWCFFFSPQNGKSCRVHFKNLWPCMCNIVNSSVYLRFYEYAWSLACTFTKGQH